MKRNYIYIYIYSCRGLRYINVIINYFLPILQDTFKQWVSIFLEGTMSKPFYDYNCTSHVIYTATLNSRVVSSHTASGTFYKVNHFHLHIIQSTTLIQLKRPTTTLAGGKAKKKESWAWRCLHRRRPQHQTWGRSKKKNPNLQSVSRLLKDSFSYWQKWINALQGRGTIKKIVEE